MSVKSDLMKQIDTAVQRKRALAKDLTRDKTIAFWAAAFFTEVERVKNLDSVGIFISLALGKLDNNLRTLDRRAYTHYREGNGSMEPQVEIHWSKTYIMSNDCDPVMTISASSAFFENTLESL